MSEMYTLRYDDLKDAAIALSEFETNLGAMMLTDALETMLTGKPRTAEQFSAALAKSEDARVMLQKKDTPFDGAIQFDWHTSKSAEEVRKMGAESVLKYLKTSAEKLGTDRDRDAMIMAKAAKMFDTSANSSAYDRMALKELFAPLAIDRQTGKPITGEKAAQVRAAALNAVAKVSGHIRSEIRTWSAISPLPKIVRRKLIRVFGWQFKPRTILVPLPAGFPENIAAMPMHTSTVQNTVLRLNLHRVACLDDTDGGELGADEIELGGAKVSGMENAVTTGSAALFGPMSAGQYRTGDSTDFPPYELDNWNLMGLQFPHVFVANLMMSERDSNDKFERVLEELVSQLDQNLPILIGAVSAAAATAIGVAIGISAGSAVVPVIGTIIGAILGALAGLLTGWISGAVDPEVFENIQERSVVLYTPDHFADGSTSTPLELLTFVDYGAHYETVINFSLHS